MASKANQAIQRKQWILFGGILGGMVAVAVVAAIALDNQSEKKALAYEKPKTEPLSVGVTQADREATESKRAGEVAELKKLLSEAQNQNDSRQKELEQRLIALKQVGEDSARRPIAPAPVSAPPGSPQNGFTGDASFKQAGQYLAPPENRATSVLGASPNGLVASKSQLSSVEISSTQAKPSGLGAVSGDMVNAAQKFGEQESGKQSVEFSRTGEDDPLAPNRGGGRSAETYIPAGTFIRAVVLHGLDAPTGGQSQQNPLPVLLQLADDAVLPNSFRAALKNCKVTANGYGDIAAERAYIRSDRLACIDENGGAIDVRLVGYIAGEDGKTGMRGRVVEKTGRILANAIFASLGSGIGQAFKDGGVSQTTNALGGTTETVTDGFKAGFGTGISKSFDRISEYYLKVAEKLFPVIEINGGRVVDIVVTRGVVIERTGKTESTVQR